MTRYSASASRQFSIRLSLSFGALIILLMTTVIIAASLRFSHLQEKEENRLSSALAVILGESITRVSFSGKYHTRLLVEEMRRRVPELAYISVESADGKVLAHSDPSLNDQQGATQEPLVPGIMEHQTPLVREGKGPIKEILLPYRPGMNAQLEGVIRLGIDVEESRRERRQNLMRLLLLVVSLSAAAIAIVYLLSRRFGTTVNSLADQLQGLLTHAPLSLAILDDRGQILGHSLEFGKVFGGASSGQDLREVLERGLQPAESTRLMLLTQGVLSGGPNIDEEVVAEGQGHHRAWHLSIFPIEQDRKENVSKLCWILRDITDRRMAEEAQRKSAAQLRTLIDTIPDLVWLKDIDGVYLECNRRFEQFFGALEHEIVGRTDYDFVDRELADFFRAHDQKAMAAGKPTMNEEEITFASDGHRECLETIKTAVWDREGRLIGVLGIGRDITGRKHAEEEQQRLQFQLQQTQKMESLGSLASGVAHDMNNVLGAILGLCEAFQKQVAPGPLHKALETISQAAQRGGQMVKSLLSFARRTPAEQRELNLNAILQEEVHLLQRTTLAKVHLALDLLPELHPVSGDPSVLAKVFMNLCVNAVDAMPEGGTLSLVTRNLGTSQVEVQIRDTGVGMSAEVLAKALDPFFTTKPPGKGTGLGLSMVYRSIQAHHGEMDIQSEPGKGTCVRVLLPACRPSATLTLPEAALAPMPSQVPSAMGILLVDDDELIRASIPVLLESNGHAVTVASSGEEALELLEAGLQPSVVVLDMNMPGLGGKGTLPRLRALRPTLPVLLATGRADQTAQALVDSDPFVTLLPKPFRFDQLQELLNRIQE